LFIINAQFYCTINERGRVYFNIKTLDKYTLIFPSNDHGFGIPDIRHFDSVGGTKFHHSKFE